MHEKLLSALLAAAILTAGIAAGAPTLQSHGHANVTNATQPSPSFADYVYRIHAGGVAAIEVTFDAQSEAVLRVGDDDDEGYSLTANVTDGNGDGRAIVLFDSGAVGSNDTTVRAVDPDDEVAVTAETGLANDSLDAGDYSLSLRDDGKAVSLGSLTVQADAAVGEFTADAVEIEQNDTATIPVALEGTDAATVRVGSEAVNYYLDVLVVDRDGDGAVTLEFDTATADTDTVVVRANGSESTGIATVRSEFSPSDSVPPLAVGNYPLALYHGNSTDEELSVGALRITDPATASTTETTDDPATTEQPLRTTTATRTTATTTEPDTGSVPGFGPSLAVTALAAAAMLAARR
ncbi:hypothetical protein BRC82_03160 [Halobacteriales archaeon QS_1_67_19]|nr:MAG: hypothetical protein BRC82_03160 [Halobacteriales archaeon QS_1_67_19]